MKYLLIAIYLGKGDIQPLYQTKQFQDKAACQALAQRYVKQVVSGQARAFCLPIKI